MFMRNYAIKYVDPELIGDRRALWDKEPKDLYNTRVAPEWVYLKGMTKESHEQFHHWAPMLMKDLECDERACQSFIKLFKMAPPAAPHGYMEACRILAHMFKDKSKNLEHAVPDDRDWSAFLRKSCDEAIEALEDPEHVKTLKRGKSSWQDWSAYNVAPPGPAKGSSSSSSSWQHSDKGKGYGKSFQRGPAV